MPTVRSGPPSADDAAAAARAGARCLTGDAYGMGLPSGQLDPMTTALLATAVDHYCAPTPAQADPAGRIRVRDCGWVGVGP